MSKFESAWMDGLLDREAGEAYEPAEWDIDEYEITYWHEYAQGVRDYDTHKKRLDALND